MAKAPPMDHDDPVQNKSLSVPLFVSTLVLMLTLVWALYDELYAMRPWKATQQQFVELYQSYLQQLRPKQAAIEQEIKSSVEYQELNQKVESAEVDAAAMTVDIEKRINRGVNPRMVAVRSAFQALRGEIGEPTYKLETATSAGKKASLESDIASIKARVVSVEVVSDDGSGNTETLQMDFAQLEAEFERLRNLRAELQAERVSLLGPAQQLRAKRSDYLKERMSGLTAQQVDGLIGKMDDFVVDIRQIHLRDIDWVDRCESCHLGAREPVALTAASMGGHEVFSGHPSRDLLKIHDPEQFGCSSCHNGNGRATSSMVKGHGRHKYWLWPLYHKENVTAGCQQCHSKEVVTPMAETLNEGRELFLNRGCWGCHRFEGFDIESDELTEVRREISILAAETTSNIKESEQSIIMGDEADEDDVAQNLYDRAEELTLRNSRIDAQIATLKQKERNLGVEVKKFGPSLREMRVKLRKEWVPVWLSNPHDFRPGSKMPVFRLLDEEVKSISAYLWQNAIDGDLRSHPLGNAARGKELFETRGCLGCHSIGEGEDRMGGTFAANLTRIGEKTNYNYLVRWIHDPSELTPDPDAPEDEVRLRPIMPNLRLSVAETRDIATYLMLQKTDTEYAEADYMDDPATAAEGLASLRHYGCAGCHEIAGLETEGRIGTELTLEGSKPLDRLDFALFTHNAKRGGWYNHKGFFERKLEDPAFFDEGKVKNHLEKLRMPNFNLSEGQVTALTTFLLGAVDTQFPKHYRYEPEDDRSFVQEGWWIIKRYNCNGCHQIRPGDETSFMAIDRYKDPDWVEQLPPQLYTEGARVQPDWLLEFLSNPALSSKNIHRNGVRGYLQARMPTFYFSDRQVGKVMRFFMARSSQPLPYLPEESQPLSNKERLMSRRLFSGRAAPCLKCHMTGDPLRDRNASAPNFLIASKRLKPEWTYRWMIEPANIAPGTAMPSELFRYEDHRWIFNGPLPAAFQDYEEDHAQLMVRYMFQFTAGELRSLLASGVPGG